MNRPQRPVHAAAATVYFFKICSESSGGSRIFPMGEPSRGGVKAKFSRKRSHYRGGVRNRQWKIVTLRKKKNSHIKKEKIKMDP